MRTNTNLTVDLSFIVFICMIQRSPLSFMQVYCNWIVRLLVMHTIPTPLIHHFRIHQALTRDTLTVLAKQGIFSPCEQTLKWLRSASKIPGAPTALKFLQFNSIPYTTFTHSLNPLRSFNFSDISAFTNTVFIHY